MFTSVKVERDVSVEMRDGTVLRADVYRPDDNGRYPAILLRTPYNKLLAVNSDFLNPVDAAFAGFALVVQDIRGRFSSGGEYAQRSVATFPLDWSQALC